MTPTRTARARVTAGLATFVTVTAVTIPLMATAASAAVSSVTANPASYQAAAGSTVPVTADVVRTAGDTTPISFAIVSGPDADAAGNGTLVADGTCIGATTPVTCNVTNTKGPGTDVVRIFADSNSNLVLDAGEPSSDATVVFYGAAAAVDLKPDSDSAAAGTCNAFTVSVSDAGGRARPGQAVQLEATLTGTTTGRNIAFCDPDGAGPATNAGGDSTASNPPGTTTQAVGTVTTANSTDPAVNGKATFGILSSEPGTATVRAYVDVNGNSTFDAGEPSDTSTKTFTAGGPAGNSAQDAVSTLAVAPTSQSVVVTDAVTYTVVAKNAAGDTTPNVVVNYTITGANPGSGTLPLTDNSGSTTLTYTANNAGTDTLTFWVNQTAGATSGADANEPKATATTTVAAAPSGHIIDLTCAGTAADTSAEDCVNPTSDNNEVFTAFVSKGVDASGNPIPSAGILVRFTTTGTNATVSPTSAVTNAQGIATTTLTDTTNSNGTTDMVTATIAGQTVPQGDGFSFDSGTKTWQTAVPSTVALAPALNTTQTGTSSTFVATVTDQFGVPVANQNVDFYIAGRNAALNGPALLNKTTDVAGKATLTYTDTGAVASPGTDTITAVADVDNDDTTQNNPKGTATNNFITEPATAGSVDLDVTGAGVCGTTTVEPANDVRETDPATTTNSVCAVAKTAGGAPLAGKTITFTLSGVGSFASADGTALTSPQTAVTNAAGVATVLVKSTQSGAQNITATIDGKSDTGTITYKAPLPAQARNIDLKPDTSDIVAGQNTELTARVTDRFGNPVSGVTVDFTETGAGSFANGTSSQSGVTGATGTVTVTLSSPSGATGTETVTAAINNGAATTDCERLAGDPTGSTAGTCSDTSTYTFKQPAPTSTVPTFIIGTNVIAAGQFTKVVINGTPGDTVQVLVKGAASTTFTVIANLTVNPAGVASWPISPSTSSNYFVRSSAGAAPAKFLLVKAVQSLAVSKSGLTGIFAGLVKPSLAGRTVTVYYYVTGGHVQIACTTKVQVGGKFRCTRGFRAGMLIHAFAQTGADKFNAAGRSGVKDLRF